MDITKLFHLYQRERQYQRCCFGEYKDLDSLNFASFLLFIEEYLKRTKRGYTGKWDQQLPDWLENTKEMNQGSSPVNAYEELIKVFVLAGAALETYCEINPDEWRKDSTEKIKKWTEQ